MQIIENNGYTKKQILDVLQFRKGLNEVKFRYDLLDKDEKKIKTLDNVINGVISMAAFAQIKRTAVFEIKEDESINYLSDRIQPFFMLKMQDGWIEYPLGIFLLSSPTRIESDTAVYRRVEAYDGLVVLRDDRFLNRYSIAAGTNYITAINTILDSAGINKINIESNENNLNSAKEFEPGIDKLKAVNELLRAINWTTLWIDERGYYTAGRYTSPSDRPAEYDYLDDDVSILSEGMEEDLDLFDVANSWAVTMSNPEELPLHSELINNNINSPTSYQNRGRYIVDFREIDNIASQEALDAYVGRLAFNASQVYGELEFATAINPLHSYSDVLNIRYENLDIDNKYSETNWIMPLQAGAMMKHEVRKIINI